MSINLERLHRNLEEKIDEGALQLSKITIGKPGYAELLKDIETTLNLLNGFKGAGEEQKETNNKNQIKVGDKFVSYEDYDDENRVVVFTSETCSFCKQMSPVYLPMLKEEGVPYELINLGVKEEKEFAAKLGITTMPFFLFVKEGIVTYKLEGYDTAKEAIENKKIFKTLIKEYL